MDKINEEAKKNELRQNYENLAVKYYNRFLMSNGLPAATNADMCERLADQLQMLFRIDWKTESVSKTVNDIKASSQKAELELTNMAEVESYSFGFLEQSHEQQKKLEEKDEPIIEEKSENGFSRPDAKTALNEYQQKNETEKSGSLLQGIFTKLGF